MCNDNNDCGRYGPIRPICNTIQGRCVCNDNNDCGGMRPICKTRQGRCVQCRYNDHCDRGVCNAKKGRCVQCNIDDDCDLGVCNKDKNLCGRCERGYYNPNRGRCEECNVDSDCKKSSLNGVLVQFCNTDWNICGNCKSDRDCYSKDISKYDTTQQCINNECQIIFKQLQNYKIGTIIFNSMPTCKSNDHCRSGVCNTKKRRCEPATPATWPTGPNSMYDCLGLRYYLPEISCDAFY